MSEIKYEIFVSDMIKFASTGKSPDYILNQLLQYIGENLDADRAYIFEDNEKGTLDNTYEWCRTGVNPEIDNLKDIPYEGAFEIWKEEFINNEHVIIEDMEEYKNVSQTCYDTLKPQGIESLVVGPIYIEGEYIGFYGVDNPPVDQLKNIAALLKSMEFVISMMMVMRNHSRIIEQNAVTDQLTGCNNRKALNWAYKGEYNRGDAIGVIMCDLNGLKKKNDLEGHEAGDRYICQAADVLVSCFGRKDVYRIGGDEFVVVLLGTINEQLEERVKQLKESFEKNGVSAAVGFAFRQSAAALFEQTMNEADEKMYEAKRQFYQLAGHDRRKR